MKIFSRDDACIVSTEKTQSKVFSVTGKKGKLHKCINQINHTIATARRRNRTNWMCIYNPNSDCIVFTKDEGFSTETMHASSLPEKF